MSWRKEKCKTVNGPKLAKNIAHFFVVQNITEGSKEVIYVYGMELLIYDMLNTIIILLIAPIFSIELYQQILHEFDGNVYILR